MNLLTNSGFTSILTDYTHGASVLTRRLLSLLSELPGAGEALLMELTAAAGLLREAHPELVSLASVMREVIASAKAGMPAAPAAHQLAERWEANQREVVSLAADYIATHPGIITVSYSGLVRDAVVAARARGCPVRVFVGEGRPRCEGLLLAAELVLCGASCTVYVDAAFADFLAQADAVLVGADAVGPEMMLNKVGTRILLQEARRCGLPTAVAYDFLKLVSAEEFPQTLSTHPADEVAGGRRIPQAVRVVNRYFELVPLNLVDTHLCAAGGK